MNGGKKIQINLQTTQYRGLVKVDGLENIPEMLFPLIYTNEVGISRYLTICGFERYSSDSLCNVKSLLFFRGSKHAQCTARLVNNALCASINIF